MSPTIFDNHIRVGHPLQVRLGVLATCIALAALSGCGYSVPPGAAHATSPILGTVLGGQIPVGGAKIQLYAAGTAGVGSPATPLLDETISSSNDGAFVIPATYNCPSVSSQLYVVARGGKPNLASTADNPSLALAALVGPCSAPLNRITVNEVTTIGSVWPLARYMKSETEIGSVAGDTAFVAATASVQQFADLIHGRSPGIATAESYFSQSAKLYSLANLLDKCTNSSGGRAGDGSACGQLFSFATPASGVVPTDTMMAAMNIAQNPFKEVAQLYGIAEPVTTFQPVLSCAPADWTLRLSQSVATPVISLATGNYPSPQTVAISDTTAGSKIYYTTDGTAPTASSVAYSSPLNVAATATIKAIALVGISQSAIATITISITAAPLAPPTPTGSAAVKLAFIQQPSGAGVGKTISPVIRVAVQDANGNTVASAGNAVGISLATATGLTGTLVVNAQNGVATFDDLIISAAGTYALTASSTVLASTISNTFSITALPTSISISPAKSTLVMGAVEQFAAVVDGTASAAVDWKVSGDGCSGAGCGVISSSGVYTAPAVMPTSPKMSITATSQIAPSLSASAAINTVPAQAFGYSLIWQDTFSQLNVCTDNTIGCNWYDPGLWYAGPTGSITPIAGGGADVRWSTGQSNASTSMSTSPQNLVGGHSWTYGYFEINMAFRTSSGSWPGLWMISQQDGPGNQTNDKLYPELDIFEWQSNDPLTFFGTIHVWKNSAFLASEGIYPQPKQTNFSNFNTYGVLWTATSVSWYLNNKLLGSVDTTQSPYNKVFAGQQPLFLVLSQQSGCNWSWTCSNQSSPLDMKVQWIHIYQLPAD